MFNKSVAGVFEQFYHQFEIAVTTVVGVGYGGLSRMRLQKIGHTHHLGSVGVVAGLCRYGGVVVVVHGYDVVESVEVVSSELTGAAVKLVAVGGSVASHPAVGQLAYVPVAYAGRVNNVAVVKSFVLEYLFSDSLGSRGPANVSEANEQY